MENWISLFTAASLGAIIIKILDIVWYRKVVEKQEYNKWLREQRLKVFSELSEALVSIGLSNKQKLDNNPFEFYALASKSYLLMEDDALQNRINSFIVYWDELLNEDILEEEKQKRYYKLTKESIQIVRDLRQEIIKK